MQGWSAAVRRTLGLMCAAAAVSAAGCKNTNFLSTRDEVRIGRDASKEIESQMHVDNKTQDAVRVRRIGERLLEHSDKRAGVPYSFKVLDTRDVNAVSLPGGPIYVFRGLLDLLGDDDDMLAGVMGHELGHTNARHAAKQISQQMATNLGIMVILRGGAAANIASLAGNLLSLSYGREDEYDSDSRGLSYSYKAGFDPHGLPRFFERLQELEKRAGGGGGPEFLRSHPLTKSRIERARRIIETKEYKFGQ